MRYKTVPIIFRNRCGHGPIFSTSASKQRSSRYRLPFREIFDSLLDSRTREIGPLRTAFQALKRCAANSKKDRRFALRHFL
jgi:hypothetical protein